MIEEYEWDHICLVGTLDIRKDLNSILRYILIHPREFDEILVNSAWEVMQYFEEYNKILKKNKEPRASKTSCDEVKHKFRQLGSSIINFKKLYWKN